MKELAINPEMLFCPYCGRDEVKLASSNYPKHEWLGYTYQCQSCQVFFNVRIYEEAQFTCTVCHSIGFKPSASGKGCTFCDGTEGGAYEPS